MNHRFYFLLTLTAALAATLNALKPVLDTDVGSGDIIFDGSYYVLPRISGPGGGGLSLTSRGGNWCPLYIKQEYSEVNRGIPIKFSDWMIKLRLFPNQRASTSRWTSQPRYVVSQPIGMSLRRRLASLIRFS
ncbi:unnamed protein product [Brassica oleracea]